jgi:Cu/Zn superoxide dismutase
MRVFLPFLLALAAGASISITGCAADTATSLGRVGGEAPRLVLTTPLVATNGATIGEAVLIEVASVDRIVIRAKGLPAGRHPVTIHAIARCSGTDFADAGTEVAGALPPIEAESDGGADLFADLPVPRLRGSTDARLDSDGLALIVRIAGQPIGCAAFRAQ